MMELLRGVADFDLRPSEALQPVMPGQAGCKWVKLAAKEAFSTSRSGWYAPGVLEPKKLQRREFWMEVLHLLTAEGNLRIDGCHAISGALSLGGPGFTDAAGLLAFVGEQDPVTALYYLWPCMGRYGIWLEPLGQGCWSFQSSTKNLSFFHVDSGNKQGLQAFLGGVSFMLAHAGASVQANYLDHLVERTLDDVARKLLGWPGSGPEGQWFYTQEKIALWQLAASMLVEDPNNLRQIEAGYSLDARQHLEAIKPQSLRCQHIQQKLLASL